jgi:hypothetical protein
MKDAETAIRDAELMEDIQGFPAPARTVVVAWQRNDGLVGVDDRMPTGFGDCSFRRLGEFATEEEAIRCALEAPGARRPSDRPLVPRRSHA